jgi:hydroxymethylbilane synthase
MMMAPVQRVLRIATRSSALALAQAHQVRDALAALGVGGELVTYETVGDKRLDRPLNELGAKGLFTEELERDLRAGTVDLCVHSLKDLPTADPDGLAVVATPPREDPRDAFVAPAGSALRSLYDLPAGARVGTSSLRRRAQLAAARPDLQIVDLRGNVGTRLRKLDEGACDAAILAAAGLRRLGLHDRITALLDPPAWLSAPGQGAIAIQTRADDVAVRDIVARLDDAPTARAVRAERALLAALDGGCQVPIGAYVDGGTLHGLVASLDGRTVVRGDRAVDGDPAAAGAALAEQLRADGAAAILSALRPRGQA